MKSAIDILMKDLGTDMKLDNFGFEKLQVFKHFYILLAVDSEFVHIPQKLLILSKKKY